MPHHITPSKVDLLKRRATRLKKASGVSQSQALDQVAVENGFQNWSQLHKAAESAKAPAKPHKIQIFCAIPRTPENTEPYFWLEEIPCLYPESHYASARWIKLKSLRHRDRSGINETLATTRRLVHFMDASGLKASRAWTSIFKGDQPYGFDHTCVWRDDQKRIIITTEPYLGNTDKIRKLYQWCQNKGWQMARAPHNIGIWNPCKSTCPNDCTSHTNLFILAPAKNGGDAEKVLSTLM